MITPADGRNCAGPRRRFILGVAHQFSAGAV